VVSPVSLLLFLAYFKPGSATTANLIVQLARFVGLRLITVVDKAKHGLRLSDHSVLRPDLLVDSHDPDRAVDIIRANTKGQLRFGIDTRGRESASSLLRALAPSKPLNGSLAQTNGTYSTPPESPKDSAVLSSHLVGLTGLPKQMPPPGTVFHTVPIKLFHEIPTIGETLVTWLERLLHNGLISPPEVIDIEHGFDGVNNGLDRMRRGEISGGKLVVRLT
jgi:threonine dehydrogenase-like Zn-dependent dehydrogenase